MNERKDVTALPSRFYLDEDVFSRLREGLFFQSWQYACHESQVSEPGCYHAFSLLDQDILLTRGKDGRLRGFYNVCQHRGHTLAAGSGKAQLLVCPYHSWSYDLEGKLRGAPGLLETAGICLTPVRVESLLGFVFVNLDAEAMPMREAYPDVAETVERLVPDIRALRLAHEHEALEACNWLVATANYNECYHCKNAHRAFSKGVVDPASYDIQPFSSGRVLRHSAQGARAEEAWYERGEAGDADYNSFYLFPGFSLQIYPGRMVNSYHWRPLDVENTLVWRSWFSADGKVDATLQKVIDLDRETTFAEDLALVKATQRGLHSRGYRPGPLVIKPGGGIESEHSVAALHGWVEEMLA